MAAFRMSFFFESLQQAVTATTSSGVGWTETWYIEDGAIASLDGALMSPQVEGYLRWRARTLAVLYRLWLVRAVEVTEGVKIRRSKLRLVNVPGTAPGATTQVNCAVLADIVRLPVVGGEPAHHRRFLVRGLSQLHISDGNVFGRAGNAGQRMVEFLQFVARGEVGALPPAGVNSGLKLRYHDPALQQKPITALEVDPANPRQILVSSTALAATAVGDRVTIRGVTFPRGVNRGWTVVALPVAPETRWTLGQSRIRLSGAWDAGTGFLSVAKYLYGAADQFVLIGLRNKKTGGLFRSLRGRRRVS